jgi:REP element-mobilizing transposase RayT
MNDLPERKKLNHSIPSWVSRDDPFFVTICCRRRGHNSLATPEVFGTIIETQKIHEAAGRLKLLSLVVMPDHLHLIAKWNHAAGMGPIVRSFKCIVAKRHAVLWQKGFFDHRLRNAAELKAKTVYVRCNPVRAGLVKAESDWPYVYLCGSDAL